MALCGSTTACCVYASLGQTAGMCQAVDEWRRGCRGLWTRCITGLTCTTGLTCLRANSNSCKTFMSCRQGYLALMRKKAARELLSTDVSSGIQHAALNGSVWGAAGYICLLFCWSNCCADILPPQEVLSLSPSSLRHRLSTQLFRWHPSLSGLRLLLSSQITQIMGMTSWPLPPSISLALPSSLFSDFPPCRAADKMRRHLRVSPEQPLTSLTCTHALLGNKTNRILHQRKIHKIWRREKFTPQTWSVWRAQTSAALGHQRNSGSTLEYTWCTGAQNPLVSPNWSVKSKAWGFSASHPKVFKDSLKKNSLVLWNLLWRKLPCFLAVLQISVISKQKKIRWSGTTHGWLPFSKVLKITRDQSTTCFL